MRADLGPWLDWWRAAGARGDGAAVHADLRAAYAEPQRHYHTLAHIAACLACFDGLRDLCREPLAVEMALWFHDAVHQPREGGNEARSAAWAHRTALAAGLPTAFADRVAGLVAATAHAVAPGDDVDTQVVIDADLAILAAEPEAFADYEAAIRREYEWVPAEVFADKRGEILAGFLARPTIFSTGRMRAAGEAAARRNLAASIARLRPQAG